MTTQFDILLQQCSPFRSNALFSFLNITLAGIYSTLHYTTQYANAQQYRSVLILSD